MSRLQSALRIVAAAASFPSAVLDHLDSIVPSIPGAFMTTVAYGDCDPRSRILRYANAGHMPFMLRTEHDTTFLWEGRSPPLGLALNVRTYAELTVPEASLLIGCTDGLVERPGESIDGGLAKLAELASELYRDSDLEAWCDSTIARLVGPNARDDSAILCIRFHDETD